VLLLGVSWLVLPAERRQTLWRTATLWVLVTALLLVTRRVSGWPLLVAALAALAIALDVIRRLFGATVESSRAVRELSRP
jgi:hypothetical protein